MAVTYTPTIGLEIHAELSTKTKMFCGSRNAPHDTAPNTHVCPICMGHPGTLPAVNGEAVRRVLAVGHALGGTLAEYSEFDRKNYFYPDIPKGYQISQYAYPLVVGGTLAGVAITRIHLEEDTARSLHDRGAGSLVDFNRAGVPLMELVTEPVMHDAETATTFAKELQLLLRALQVSHANMERGEMRIEVNISLSATNQMGTKVEVKNINSFKAVAAAIAYEIDRQTGLLEAGRAVAQETRGWDETQQVSVSQRKKESSHDYRYFPDPDIPKILRSEADNLSQSRLDEMLKEIPSNKRTLLSNLGLPSILVEVLIADTDASSFYLATLQSLNEIREYVTDDDRRKIASYLTSDLMGMVARGAGSLSDASPDDFARLISMISDGIITSRVAKDMLSEVVFQHVNPEELTKKRGTTQNRNTDDLTTVVQSVIQENPTVVASYRAGKESALQFLIGQAMKKTNGAADPTSLSKLFQGEIASAY